MPTLSAGITHFGKDPKAADLAGELADRLVDFDPGADLDVSVATGISLLGVGLISNGEGVDPVLLVPHQLSPEARSVSLLSLEALMRYVDAAIGRPISEAVVVRGLAPASLHAGAGESAWSTDAEGTRSGTFGPFLRDSGGGKGILIAGHVAGGLNASVSDVGGEWGRVASIETPGQKSSYPAADCAFVVPLDPKKAPRSYDVVIGSTGIPDPDQEVTSFGTGGIQTSAVELFAEWLYIPSTRGKLGRVYKTYTLMSYPGDSGAPVLLSNSSSIAGSVVAGSEDETYFQAIDYQLDALNASLDLT